MGGLARSLAGLAWICVAACGRLSFDGAGDGAVGGDDSGGDGPRACTSPSGHDEDGDGIDDTCDLCPQLADPGQENRDDDGVGDACDPRPDIPGDSIVRFDPFTSHRSDFESGTAAMEVYDGESIQIDARGATWAGDYATTIGQDTLIIAGTQGARGNASLQLVSLFVANDPAKYQCQESEPGPQASYSQTLDGTNYMNFDVQPLTGGVPMGPFELQLAHTAGDTTITCTYNGTVSTAARPSFDGNLVSINVIDEVARLDWLIQIRSE